MKKPRLTLEMKQFVPHLTTPSDRSRVRTEAVSLRVLLSTPDYFREKNKVETESGHFGYRTKEQRFQVWHPVGLQSSPKKEPGKQLSARLSPSTLNLEMDLSCRVSVLKAFSRALQSTLRTAILRALWHTGRMVMQH